VGIDHLLDEPTVVIAVDYSSVYEASSTESNTQLGRLRAFHADTVNTGATHAT